MRSEIRALERAALAAHDRGEDWATFWPCVAHLVRQAEPYDRQRYRRLAGRLMHLLLTGDPSGEMPPGDDIAPWETDDRAGPHDTRTSARLQPGVIQKALDLRDDIRARGGRVILAAEMRDRGCDCPESCPSCDCGGDTRRNVR